MTQNEINRLQGTIEMIDQALIELSQRSNDLALDAMDSAKLYGKSHFY